MTKHIKSRPAGSAPAAETRSDLTGADHGQGNAVGSQRRHLGITMKQPLLHSVSAAERLRIWLLKQAWFHSRLLPALPRQLRWILRKMYLAPIDLADRLLGRHDPGLPPKAHMFTGAPMDFAASGRRALETLCSITAANPSSHILEVGCGIGRLAIAMPDFLDANGGYEGFDIVPQGIEWCKQHIVGPHDNIHFTLADVYNKEYNPKGSRQAADYQFPYEDETFDVAVLVSVFTHMLPTDVDRYVGEIARVLKKNGRICASYSIITPESLQLMTSGNGSVHFKYNLGSYWISSKKVPELGVAYDERYLRGIYSKHGLSDPPDIYYGRWCGRSTGLDIQDVVVATKL
jgi:ubiquinone/menaquinone biosynthesis C-methylase UbiE